MTAYYAATTGSDSNPGTEASPKRSPGAALALAVAGDTVHLRAGTYTASTDRIDSSLHTFPSGTSGSRITLRNYPGETVIIRPSGLGGSSRVVALGSKSYLTFQNLTFDCSDFTADHTGSCVKCDGTSSYLQFLTCEVMGDNGSACSGYLFTGTGGNHEITGGSVHHHGTDTSLDHGIYVSVPDCVIDGVDINHNAALGVHPYDVADAPRTIVRNCLVRNNTYGIGVYNPKMQVYNNVCRNNSVGIIIRYGAVSSLIYHNTCYGNTTYGVDNDSSTTAATDLRNNILWGNGVRDFHGGFGQTPGYAYLTANIISTYYYLGGSLPSGNLSSDPLFVDAAGADFRIRQTSPACWVGAQVGVATDYAGKPRTKPSIGAYEPQLNLGRLPLNLRARRTW